MRHSRNGTHTDRIEDYAALAWEFLARVFELEPGDYVITNESELHDFTDFGA